MFNKILIANRGEIALRIICACRELGIKTVAVYSEADEHSLHVRFADEDVCIGPARSLDSYLSVPAIISAAEITGADAIHPGYGFLSESAYLAEVCEACHIKFIGPYPNVIRLLGDKARARRAMKKAGVPVLPGSDGPVQGEDQALKVAKELGYPLIIKAVAGGGGRGMRIVQSGDELPKSLKTAQREAEAAFGVGDVYLEKYVESPRHIEVQVLGDHHGHVVHLGERECSIQRRHQKLIEEAPSVALTDKQRRRLGATVVEAARAVQYTNAGTFEFLMDTSGHFFFLEVNTRLQVEHPVTEFVTGVDIVKEQIRVAAGQRLSFRQSDIEIRGHSIECRVNAEDPETFTPSPGVIHAFSVPGGPGVRVDTFVHSECTVSPYYDSLIAKIITYGRDRTEAIARMRRTLEMTVVDGIKTSIPLQLKIINDPDFVAGRLSTSFMDRHMPDSKKTGGKLAESAQEGNAQKAKGKGLERPVALPRLYAILDIDHVRSLGLHPLMVTRTWLDAGVRLVQLRAKTLSLGPCLELADQMAEACRQAAAVFIVNDRVDVAGLCGASGVHVGQDDLSPEDTRALLPDAPWIGLSTHTEDQAVAGLAGPATYIATGPVFPTGTKEAGHPVVGLDGVQRVAQLARPAGRPVVAIGGITLETAPGVVAAGAHSVAVISDLLRGGDVTGRARAFVRALA